MSITKYNTTIQLSVVCKNKDEEMDLKNHDTGHKKLTESQINNLIGRICLELNKEE